MSGRRRAICLYKFRGFEKLRRPDCVNARSLQIRSFALRAYTLSGIVIVEPTILFSHCLFRGLECFEKIVRCYSTRRI
jgi:hypothetical protein